MAADPWLEHIVMHGAPAEKINAVLRRLVASLQADLVLPHTTELICQVHPGHPTPDQIVTALERIATEVAPALGWRKNA